MPLRHAIDHQIKQKWGPGDAEHARKLEGPTRGQESTTDISKPREGHIEGGDLQRAWIMSKPHSINIWPPSFNSQKEVQATGYSYANRSIAKSWLEGKGPWLASWRRLGWACEKAEGGWVEKGHGKGERSWMKKMVLAKGPCPLVGEWIG